MIGALIAAIVTAAVRMREKILAQTSYAEKVAATRGDTFAEPTNWVEQIAVTKQKAEYVREQTGLTADELTVLQRAETAAATTEAHRDKTTEALTTIYGAVPEPTGPSLSGLPMLAANYTAGNVAAGSPAAGTSGLLLPAAALVGLWLLVKK